MKKIISLFARNYDTDGLVRNEIVPGAEWVVKGEGVATRKWDGTCCMMRGGILYKRYDAKRGKTPPANFEPAQDPDPITGHRPGWVPVGNGPEDKWHREGLEGTIFQKGRAFHWTYELIGPKLQGNPEGACCHLLIPHGYHSPRVDNGAPRDFEGLRNFLTTANVEGIVWWRDPLDLDCDKVKIKTKDFGLTRAARV